MNPDFLIIGGGINGICIARELKKQSPKASIILIEKEEQCGQHASGRNSGVLHAGFYYSSDSLKAQFCKSGNQQLTEYCLSNKLKINRCGKLIVAQSQKDLNQMATLLNRAQVNEVHLKEISEQEAKSIEPNVKTFKKALFSPTTSTIDPVEILNSLKTDAQQKGVSIHTKVRYLKKTGNIISTSKGNYTPGFVINAGGLYADLIAKDFGFGKEYQIVPFKGIYLISKKKVPKLNTHIYPVPPSQNPFLGVHLTSTVNQHIKIGPTAIPALWREQYKNLKNFKLQEFIEILWRQTQFFFNSDFNHKRIALNEIGKISKARLIKKASKLYYGLDSNSFYKSELNGIRAQLINLKTKSLVSDFVVHVDNRSLHILNAVSPAFTSCLPFSKFIVEKIFSPKS